MIDDNGDLDSLVESVGRQVAEFAARIEEEEITDLDTLSAFVKLGNYHNRLRESAGQSRVKKEDNGAPDIDEMSDHEFLDAYYGGELDEWIAEVVEKGHGDPSHARLVVIEDEVGLEWERRKPKLRIPVLLHVST